jgi:quercetin dioxygenase-like cupin family protein
MDALVAAPGSHRVLLENDWVRVLEVVIEPGAREPEHTHQAPSVMIVDEPAPIRYYAGAEPNHPTFRSACTCQSGK